VLLEGLVQVLERIGRRQAVRDDEVEAPVGAGAGLAGRLRGRDVVERRQLLEPALQRGARVDVEDAPGALVELELARQVEPEDAVALRRPAARAAAGVAGAKGAAADGARSGSGAQEAAHLSD